jgi:tetratricopeptide (TPR) repeat protein
MPWVLVMAIGCGGGVPEVEEVAHPGLEDAEAVVAEQIGAARERVTVAQSGRAGRTELADASGELGRLYQAYGFAEAARGAYRNAVALAPETFRWHYMLGTLEDRAGNLADARTAFESALEIQPTDTSALLHLGAIFLEEGDHGSARDLYQQAVEADPRCGAGHAGLGLAALGTDEYAAAAPSLEAALELDPEATQIHSHLAAAYRGLDQVDRADEQLALAGSGRASCPDPLLTELPTLLQGARALTHRAERAITEGSPDLARTLARQAIAADADLAAPRRLLGRLLIERGDLNAALRELSTAAELAPEDPGTQMLIGQAHRTAGDLEDSLRHLQKAVELGPQGADAHLQLALTRIAMGHWSAARSGLQKAVELEPTHLQARAQLGRTLAATGNQTEAIATLEQVIADAPNYALAHAALGAIQLERGRTTAAREHFQAALQGDGSAETWALAHFQLARIAAEAGDGELGETHLRTALTLRPNFYEAQIALGQLVSALGRHAEAAEIFAEEIARRPNDSGAYKGEALALLLAGRHLEARGRLERAAAKFPADGDIGLMLARLLATAPAPRVRNGNRALQIGISLWTTSETLANGETVAMAYAELGRFDEALEWQTRMVEAAREGEVDEEILAEAERRLLDYQRGNPARSVWQPQESGEPGRD